MNIPSGRETAVVIAANLLWLPQRLDVFDERPGVVLGQLALEGRHCRRMAVHDLVVQDAFRIEFVTELVVEISRRLVLARIGTVAFAERPVAFLAIRCEESLPLLHQVGRGLQRALLLFVTVWNRPS